MDGFELYEDIKLDIIHYKTWMVSVEKEWNNVRSMSRKPPVFKGVVDSTKERVTGGLSQIPLDMAEERERVLEDRYRSLNFKLQECKQLLKDVEEDLRGYEGLPRKIRYLKIVERKSLKEIADELGYSYDWIREVHSKAKHPQTTHSAVD